MFCLVGENPTCSSRHCSDARVYGHTTTAMHDEYTPHLDPPPEGDEISKKLLCKIRENVMSAQMLGGVSIRSRNGASSRKRRVVSGQMTKAGSK